MVLHRLDMISGANEPLESFPRYLISINCLFLSSTTMSWLSKGGVVEYGDSDGLVTRGTKRSRKSLNTDMNDRSRTNMAAQIAGTLTAINSVLSV
jgi:hypothetical protein